MGANSFHRTSKVGVALLLLALFGAPIRAETGAPAFSTAEVSSGLANGKFYVFMLLENSGADAASAVELTSATLAGEAPLSPALPTLSRDIVAADLTPLELQFDAGRLQQKSYFPEVVPATVANLESIFHLDAGVLYFGSHGGISGSGTASAPKFFALWTATPVTIASESTVNTSGSGAPNGVPAFVWMRAEKSANHVLTYQGAGVLPRRWNPAP